MRLLDRFMDWEANTALIGVIVGLGFLSYIVTSWVVARWGRGSYALSISAALTGILLAGLASVRIPIAQILVFGGAAVAMAAFLSGHLDLFLP